jgi:hypothetical protein
MRDKLGIVGLAALMAGCQARPEPRFVDSPEIALTRPVPSGANGVTERLSRFHFGGVYQIVDQPQRRGDAALLSTGHIDGLAEFQDGAVDVRILAVPYGVRVEIFNHFIDAVSLNGMHCAIVDDRSNVHQVELRSPEALYPGDAPSPQAVIIPSHSRCTIDLDIITPEFRSQIMRWARTPEERGAFVAPRAPLPIFCSGFYSYPSQWPDLEVIWKDANAHPFKVYFELELNSGGGQTKSYEYLFPVKAYKFAMGPKDDLGWTTAEPTPYAGQGTNAN